MLVFGTQMTITTFFFVCIELVIFMFLIVLKAERPSDKNHNRNITLTALLLIYNITGGLLPDPNLPGSIFLQNVIAYSTGIFTPMYYVYYLYKCFNVSELKFQATRGIYFFLLVPFLIFIAVYRLSNLKYAEYVLMITVIYSIYMAYLIGKSALINKYAYQKKTSSRFTEYIIICSAIIPWVGLPLVGIFDLSQTFEAFLTNPSFLLMLFFEIKKHVATQRAAYLKLQSWNEELAAEVKQQTGAIQQLHSLQAQMNPHFIFNSLASISYYITNNEPKNAVSYLAKFGKLIRAILDNSRHETICLKEELHALELYLEMENIRLKGKIRHEINISGELNTTEIQIPPLIIQPFVENSIWHGLVNKQGDGMIQVFIKKTENSAIEIIIEDNGIGREASKKLNNREQVIKKSHGIKITNERIRIMNELNGIVSENGIEDLFDNYNNPIGTKVSIKIFTPSV